MIVDTSALCAVLFDEPSREQLLERLTGAPRLRTPATVLVELGVVLDARGDQRATAFAGRTITALGIELQPITPGLAELARDAHRRYGRGSGHRARLNFGDCFSYALAISDDDTLLFVGDDFTHTDVRR